jgi:hypothetical protein
LTGGCKTQEKVKPQIRQAILERVKVSRIQIASISKSEVASKKMGPRAHSPSERAPGWTPLGNLVISSASAPIRKDKRAVKIKTRQRSHFSNVFGQKTFIFFKRRRNNI